MIGDELSWSLYQYVLAVAVPGKLYWQAQNFVGNSLCQKYAYNLKTLVKECINPTVYK